MTIRRFEEKRRQHGGTQGQRKRSIILVVAMGVVLSMLWSSVSGAPIDDLRAHLDLFISNNFPGEMSYSATEFETISPSSDLDALANMIVDNFYVINQTATENQDTTGTEFVQLSGPGKQDYIDLELMPKMVTGALVAGVEWTWNSQVITTYALVSPGPNEPGDTDNLIESVTRFYVIPEPPPEAPNPFHKGFKNGFGTHVSDFDASLDCFAGTTCSGDATCNEARPLCGCDKKKSVKCLANGNCQMDVAFVGHCGFPSIKFKAKDFEFEVGWFGWAYYNARITLNKVCNCTPDTLGACILPEDQGCLAYVTYETCEDFGGEWQGAGSICEGDIPTLTEWGLIIFGVVLIGFITYVFLRRRKVIGVRA